MSGSRNIDEIRNAYPAIDEVELNKQWVQAYASFKRKIIVLDDDPTGVQTVHNISVYTDWSEETIDKGFQADSQMFFILTNSRAFTAKETKEVHKTIAARIERVSRKYNKSFLVISRSDSTLRGHFPLETETMRQSFEEQDEQSIDGEILIPYFKEGGRLTLNNTHFIRDGAQLIPAGETEFARDRTFGFKASHLGHWIEEKTEGLYKEEEVTYISLTTIRAMDIEEIVRQLNAVTDFKKVVVNALEEDDLKVFSLALIEAMHQGKNFMLRTGATFTKIIGNIPEKKLLTKSELIDKSVETGGLVLIGSHVQKTTQQLQELKKQPDLKFIEFDVHLVLDTKRFTKEIHRVQAEAERLVTKGVTTVIYTRRERMDLGEGMKEEELKLAVSISDALTEIVRTFSVRPKYMIAKGGITSSDIGAKGLKVKRATVIGQVAPGVPVWRTGEESKFPNLSYIIFPGNVGSDHTLKDIVRLMEE